MENYLYFIVEYGVLRRGIIRHESDKLLIKEVTFFLNTN